MSNTVLNNQIITPGANIDGEYMNNSQPWASVQAYLDYKDNEYATIPVPKTIFVDGYGEMWNNGTSSSRIFKVKEQGERDRTSATKGYIVLGKSETFANQVTHPGTTYEIRYDFDLGGVKNSIPEGCTLFFNGGRLKNGTLRVTDTVIERSGDYTILQGVTFSGDGKIGSDLRMSYFDWDNTYSANNYQKLSNLYGTIYGTPYNIIYDIRELYIAYNKPIRLEANKVYDFNNVTIYSHSTTLSQYLFLVDEYDVELTDYKKLSLAAQDEFFTFKQGVMVVDDLTPLYTRVSNGVNYYRRDMILVQNNEMCTAPIMDYDDDPDTDARIKFMSVTHGGFKFCNLRYDRTGSEEMSPLLWVNYCYKPEVYNVTIDSDHPEFKGYCESGTLRFEYVFQPYLHDLSLDSCLGDVVGTNQAQYNIVIQGATKVVIERVNANAKWHSFGNQSINGAVCRDCILDQWDSHTYGRDYLFENCTFHTDHLGAPEVGIMKFVHCRFLNSRTGYLSDSDTASFPTHRIFEGCVFDDHETSLVAVSPIYTPANPRVLLVSEKYPSLTVRDCIINVATYKTTWVMYEVNSVNTSLIQSNEMADIRIENLTINTNSQESLRLWLINAVNINANIKIDDIKSNKGNVYIAPDNNQRGFLQIDRCRIRISDNNVGSLINSNPDQFYNNYSNNVLAGTTQQRPSTKIIGTQYFDTTLGKAVWWNGTEWV